MSNVIKLRGIIKFDPKDVTKKHLKQSNWKKIAMVMFEGDICEYYSWWVNRRYNLKLNKPLRGGHITFINDRSSEIKGDWSEVKKKYNNKPIDIILDLTPKTDSNNKGSTYHWWLSLPEKNRKELHDIRLELGLGRPYWGLHMTIGHANPKQIEHSKYLHRCLTRK